MPAVRPMPYSVSIESMTTFSVLVPTWAATSWRTWVRLGVVSPGWATWNAMSLRAMSAFSFCWVILTSIVGPLRQPSRDASWPLAGQASDGRGPLRRWVAGEPPLGVGQEGHPVPRRPSVEVLVMEVVGGDVGRDEVRVRQAQDDRDDARDAASLDGV